MLKYLLLALPLLFLTPTTASAQIPAACTVTVDEVMSQVPSTNPTTSFDGIAAKLVLDELSKKFGEPPTRDVDNILVVFAGERAILLFNKGECVQFSAETAKDTITPFLTEASN